MKMQENARLVLSRLTEIKKMKHSTLLLAMVITCLSLATAIAQTDQALKLDVPVKWRAETVKLPPPFAPKVSLKGKAKVYFSPGWGEQDSDQFFTYAFLFQTEAEPKFDKELIKKELLAYFGGLAAEVSGDKVDAATLKMTVKEIKVASEGSPGSTTKPAVADGKRFTAELKWTEPFFTESQQTLKMELVSKFNEAEDKNYLMVCVSPQDPKSKAEPNVKVWQELRKIQASFCNPKGSVKTPSETK